MKIERVKQRGFVRVFAKWKFRCVEVIGKGGEEVGTWLPAGELNKLEGYIFDLIDNFEKKVVDKKQIADEIVDKVQSGAKYQVEHGINPEDMVDEVEATETVPIKLERERDASHEAMVKELYECQRCDKGFADLWIVWEDGEERHFCGGCIPNNFRNRDAFERYLNGLEKVGGQTQEKIVFRKSSVSSPLKPQTKADNFNQQPKPPPKKKKKS